MAIWQFAFHLLPRESVEQHFGILPLMIKRREFDQVKWWQEPYSTLNLTGEFSKFLSKAPSWSEDIEIWGKENEDRIDVVRENGQLADLYVRVDVRKISFSFLMQVLGLAQKYNWLLLTQSNYVLFPSFGKLLSAIHRSDSFKFVENPQAFLTELEKSQNDA